MPGEARKTKRIAMMTDLCRGSLCIAARLGGEQGLISSPRKTSLRQGHRKTFPPGESFFPALLHLYEQAIC